MKNKWKWFLFLLIFVISVGLVWYFFIRQPKAQILDEIKDGKNYIEKIKNNGQGGKDKENEVILNRNVHMYIGESADRINMEIQGVEQKNKELVLLFSAQTGTEFVNLEIGELFWLEGNKSTPLCDTYIGKVTSNIKRGDEIQIGVEPPMMDEVFDKVYLDEELKFDASDINSISMIDGVKFTPVDKIPINFMEVSSEEPEVNNLLYDTSSQVNAINTASINAGNFILELDIDLVKLLQEKKENNDEKDEILKGGKELKIKGKIGVEDLTFNVKTDFDKKMYGLKELAMGVSGKQVANIGFEIKYKGEVSGNPTEMELKNFIKVQGLDKKLLPIAYLDCASKKAVIWKPNIGNTKGKNINEKLEKDYKVIPFSCGFMVYMDFNGNLSFETTYNFEYQDEFKNTLVIKKNNKWVQEFEGYSKPSSNHKFKVEAQADADTHLGISAQAYFFNINIAEIAIVKFGTELEGKGSLRFSSSKEEDNVAQSSFYGRGYLKALDVKVKIKAQPQFWKDAIKISDSWEYEKTFLDQTLFEIGKKQDTHYDENTMLWKKITAEDEQALYYKGINGKLIRENKKSSSRIGIYTDDFFSICGVDQSYIYVLQADKDETYNVRRIRKDGVASKVIIKNVKYVLLMDNDKIFYVAADTPRKISVLNRETLKKSAFMECEESVEYMTKEAKDYFVITKADDFFSRIWGAECNYHRISKDGKILQSYDSNIEPKDMMKEKSKGYYIGYKLVSNGYLREVAEKVYWCSQNQSSYKETEGCSGWHPTDRGIFTEQETDEGYVLTLWQSENGAPRNLTKVASKMAVFTLVQDSGENWYYIDQTEDKLILYRMDSMFQNKEQIDIIEREDLAVDLENCGMEIVDNRIFFYTMPEWSQSEVLYRYNLF